MPASLKLSRRISTAARWPLGVGLTSWRYMWRTSPMRRREVVGDPESDRPPAYPEGFDMEGVQPAEVGVGPLYHRRYRIRVEDAQISVSNLMERMRRSPDDFAPSEFASFQKASGDGPLKKGDEYVVRMPGPWDGPVRVIDVDESSFRLATLEGHLEAGQIEFRAEQDGELRFTIESWARSADRLSDLLYSRLRMAKEVQLHMWVSFLERIVKASGGRRSGLVEIETRRIDDHPGA
jgi:Domain of unknown function (DUF1990)